MARQKAMIVLPRLPVLFSSCWEQARFDGRRDRGQLISQAAICLSDLPSKQSSQDSRGRPPIAPADRRRGRSWGAIRRVRESPVSGSSIGTRAHRWHEVGLNWLVGFFAAQVQDVADGIAWKVGR